MMRNNTSTKESIVKEYIRAYNRFDVPGMIKHLHGEVEFQNITNGEVGLETKGIRPFEDQARATLDYFKNRHQKVVSLVQKENTVSVEIEFSAVLAMDFPNGLQCGDTMRLRGRSLFVFQGEKIRRIIDES